jgi:glucose-1-phosphate cytidylyltransferase
MVNIKKKKIKLTKITQLDMKVVILAGGFGSRIADHSVLPKPMIPVGKYPIIEHIMRIYIQQGFKKFIIPVGYKGEIIEKFFKKNKKIFSGCEIQVIKTGLNSYTGERLKKIKHLITEENFMVTYGDGLSNIDLKKLIKFHIKHKKTVTVTAVHPPARFGELELNSNNIVKSFTEKPQLQSGWINGGFFVFKKNFFNLIPSENVMLERKPLALASRKKQFMAFKHESFWYCIDNRRDHEIIQKIYRKGNAPWLNLNK